MKHNHVWKLEFFAIPAVVVIGLMAVAAYMSVAYVSATGGENRDISAEQLINDMKNSDDLTVVCVLPQESFDKLHIKGSTCVPLQNLKAESKLWAKNKNIAVYCASKACLLSNQAYELLVSLGFSNVRVYEGGVQEWSDRGFPVAGSDA